MTVPIASDRRQFVKIVGLAVLADQCMPMWGQASDEPSPVGEDPDGVWIIRSSPGLLHHWHDLSFPRKVLEAPPLQGVQLVSTQALFHTHEIALSQKELIFVNQGGTVTRKASSHLFVIALAPEQGATPKSDSLRD